MTTLALALSTHELAARDDQHGGHGDFELFLGGGYRSSRNARLERAQGCSEASITGSLPRALLSHYPLGHDAPEIVHVAVHDRRKLCSQRVGHPLWELSRLPAPCRWHVLAHPGSTRHARAVLAGSLGLAPHHRVLARCLLAVGLAVGGTSCNSPAQNLERTSASASPLQSTDRSSEQPLANERVDIPGGAFTGGSVPGEPGRRPELEPRTFELELGPFQIDRLPYPNDPARRPVTGLGRQEATRLCAERGQRLCTELEWERACKGPASDVFSGGASWDARCAEETASCTSGFNVLSMGTRIREWTISDVVPPDPDPVRRASVRGASATAPGPEHRCANRYGIDPLAAAPDLGFRCCKGAANAAVVPEPRVLPAFRKLKLSAERLEKLLLGHPRTARLGQNLKFFRDPESVEAILARGPGDRKGFSFTAAPLVWSPVAGTEILVFTARSGESTSCVLAYWVADDDQYVLASSFVMENEPGPVALAYSDSIRPRLHFTTCWGCLGETGKVLFRPPESVVILQP
jgi:hypothetical protein